MIHKSKCCDDVIWNPSTYDFECDKSTDVRESLAFENCKCRKNQVDKLVKECSEYIDGNNMIYNFTLSDHAGVCKSCTIYVALLIIAFLIIMNIDSAFFISIGILKKVILKH